MVILLLLVVFVWLLWGVAKYWRARERLILMALEHREDLKKFVENVRVRCGQVEWDDERIDILKDEMSRMLAKITDRSENYWIRKFDRDPRFLADLEKLYRPDDVRVSCVLPTPLDKASKVLRETGHDRMH